MFSIARARLTGRSLWQVTYLSGDTISEWQMDWAKLPTEGRSAVKLLCPNGQTFELAGTPDATGRLFQFKVAEIRPGFRGTLAHVIGIVRQPDGSCEYAAWDYQKGELETGYDNVQNMRYHQTGMLSHEVMGLSYG